MSTFITLNADPENVVSQSAWVGEWHTYVCRLVDDTGAPVDITTGTLSATYTDVNTGSAYSFGGGTTTITKQYSSQGVISILFPAAFPAAAVVRITVAITNGTTVTRYGPLVLTILAP